MVKPLRFLFVYAMVVLGGVWVAACGGEDESEIALDPAPGAGGERVAAPSVLAESPGESETPTSPSLSETAAAELPADGDPLLVCEVADLCEKRCADQCMTDQWDKAAFYEAKKARIAQSPFEIEIHRAYLKGACHEGGMPERRRQAAGIAAVVEGQVTYKGDDVLYKASPEGQMVLRVNDSRFVEAEVAPPVFNRAPASRFLRPVHGSDPWLGGQTRAFHWESSFVDPVFCEVVPKQSGAHIDMVTEGVRNGRRIYPVGFVSLAWDEVVGMALRQEVKVQVRKGAELIEEPADAHYAKRDRILITRLTGATGWVNRKAVVQDGDLTRAPQAAFPVASKSDAWTVRVTGISQVKEYGGFAPSGEDQFLAVVSVEIGYAPGSGEPVDPASLKRLRFRLETSSDRWQTPVTRAAGQLDTAQSLQPGGKAEGVVVFPKQRFERPFRLEVKTPDKGVLYLDVLSYELGPERSPS